MLQIQNDTFARNCQGMTRRSALKAGFLGLAGLTLPDLLRLRAEGSARKKETAVILLWLDGGPSQLETYDPKPEAPAEYRGPYGAVRTNVPGIRISETLPLHAKHADKSPLFGGADIVGVRALAGKRSWGPTPLFARHQGRGCGLGSPGGYDFGAIALVSAGRPMETLP